MVNIEVNGRNMTAEPGEMILSVLRRNGIDVPTLCHIEHLVPSGACRMCVVEVEGQKNLVPSCAYPVADGMKIKTHSTKAIRARKTIVELLLADHPDDCNYCARNNNCQLQTLASQLGVNLHRYGTYSDKLHLDKSSASLIRDPAKCILCGRCVRVCEEIQGVSAIDFIGRGSTTQVGTAYNQGLNISSCINCGQCVIVCPTAALTEQSHIKQVLDALEDPEKVVVVQHAPSISVTIAEEFGIPAGSDYAGALTAALRHLGFDYVFDTSFSADLTIMEEASELVHRVQNSGKLPMFTSCSPGWVKFMEHFYPDMLDHLSSCKSPQQMMGALVKSFFAERMGIDPSKIYSVSLMPCTAKKYEAGREELGNELYPDIDAVLTTRELATIIRMFGMDLNSIEAEPPDTPFGERSTAGKLFGATGGVMEAALRTAYFLITGKNLDKVKIEEVRGLEGIKEAKVKVGDLEVGVAVASGLSNARKLVEQIRNGRTDLHFIEIMTCPGGCIAGGGQPLNTDIEQVKARMKALYNIDRNEVVRLSHENRSIQKLYEEFLERPLSEKSHHLLHTHYHKQDVIL